MPKPRGLKTGFTLIELMLVSAIIGLLASIAIPKFGGLIVKAKEASVRGKLGSLRSAINIYYADNDGTYPICTMLGLWGLTYQKKYIDEFPRISIPTAPEHTPSSRIFGVDADWFDFGGMPAGWFQAWRYLGPATGRVVVGCFHKDSTGQVWSTW